MSEIVFVPLGPGDYDRAKKIFNEAKHPGFIGREMVYRAATTGQACVAALDEKDVGVALIAKGKLLALSVVKAAQGRGVGGALMAHLQPEWVSAIAEKISWFEKQGYESVGAAKVGQNGKTSVQLMRRRADASAAVAPVRDVAPPKSPTSSEAQTINPAREILDGFLNIARVDMERIAAISQKSDQPLSPARSRSVVAYLKELAKMVPSA